jgi:hypothetical protein
MANPMLSMLSGRMPTSIPPEYEAMVNQEMKAPTGRIPLAQLLALKQYIDRAKRPQGQEGPTQTVAQQLAEQAFQGRNPYERSRDIGVAGLPTQEGFGETMHAANGGIIAFADRGSVDAEDMVDPSQRRRAPAGTSPEDMIEQGDRRRHQPPPEDMVDPSQRRRAPAGTSPEDMVEQRGRRGRASAVREALQPSRLNPSFSLPSGEGVGSLAKGAGNLAKGAVKLAGKAALPLTAVDLGTTAFDIATNPDYIDNVRKHYGADKGERSLAGDIGYGLRGALASLNPFGSTSFRTPSAAAPAAAAAAPPAAAAAPAAPAAAPPAPAAAPPGAPSLAPGAGLAPERVQEIGAAKADLERATANVESLQRELTGLPEGDRKRILEDELRAETATQARAAAKLAGIAPDVLARIPAAGNANPSKTAAPATTATPPVARAARPASTPPTPGARQTAAVASTTPDTGSQEYVYGGPMAPQRDIYATAQDALIKSLTAQTPEERAKAARDAGRQIEDERKAYYKENKIDPEMYKNQLAEYDKQATQALKDKDFDTWMRFAEGFATMAAHGSPFFAVNFGAGLGVTAKGLRESQKQFNEAALAREKNKLAIQLAERAEVDKNFDFQKKMVQEAQAAEERARTHTLNGAVALLKNKTDKDYIREIMQGRLDVAHTAEERKAYEAEDRKAANVERNTTAALRQLDQEKTGIVNEYSAFLMQLQNAKTNEARDELLKRPAGVAYTQAVQRIERRRAAIEAARDKALGIETYAPTAPANDLNAAIAAELKRRQAGG